MKKFNLSDEPVAYVALIQAVLVLAMAFGLHLDPDQIAAIVAVANAVLAILLRRKVTPTKHVALDARADDAHGDA